MDRLSFWFFKEVTLNENYQEINFNYNHNLTKYLDILLFSDSNAEIMFSWDGATLAGFLKAKEQIQITDIKKDRIFVKGSGTMRIWVQK